MDYAELGRRIRVAREEASLSQDAVAKHLDMPRSAVSLIESGRRKVDSLELERFSRLVGKSILFFFDEGSVKAEISNFEEDDPTQVLFSANQVVDISPDKERIEHFRQFHHNFRDLARKLNRISEPLSTEPLYNVFKPTPAAAKWMAAQERARLGIPISSPIRNMWEILENEGVRVMAWDLETPKLGGCFIFSRLLGSFVLVKRNLGEYSGNKLNFVMAHEYCHHLIHRQQKGITCNPSSHYRKPEEYFANWFAANFLMPEEAIVPKLATYLEDSNTEITAEIVMHLALDFGVSYRAMLYRLGDKRIELIDKNIVKKLEKEKPKLLLAQIGRSAPRLEKINYFPNEYIDMNFEAYRLGYISLSKLAQLLKITLEEAKEELRARDIPINLGVNSKLELLSDIENA